MLSILKGDIATGFYSSGVKVIEQLFIIPTIVAFVFFPVFSRLSVTRKQDSMRAYKLILPWLFLIGIIFSLAVHFNSSFIIRVIYGDAFLPAQNVLSITAWSVVPLFLKPFTEKFLYSLKIQRFVLISYLFGAMVNVFLSSAWIPNDGIIGASWANVVSETLIAVAIILYTNKIFKKRKQYEQIRLA